MVALETGGWPEGEPELGVPGACCGVPGLAEGGPLGIGAAWLVWGDEVWGGGPMGWDEGGMLWGGAPPGG